MNNFNLFRLLFAVICLPLNLMAENKEQEICIYQDNAGKIIQVNSLDKIPGQYKLASKCFRSKIGEYLARPEDVKLEGNIRREDMTSSLGRIQLKWPRKVELLFGRTPQRAVADAISTASRALKNASFPPALQTLQLEWSIVFMDEELPEAQIPYSLISNCHPAWMTPPSNIYIASQRVAAGCGGQRVGTQVADSELAHILLHEIGHVIEYQMLKQSMHNDRMLAEGFASWFELYASDYSSIIPKGKIKTYYMDLAKRSILSSPNFSFRGTAEDYARASLFFTAIVERKGVRGISDVYETIVNDRVNFFTAVDKRLNWDEKRFGNEIEKLFKSD